ncbi:DNA-binding transcriptional regulator, MerR family [Thermomonospora echinospora]|uniref:DNA-binding transcriptional regulator, MerR family n=1 Tax=Thermomonospora echinospora TaxID=1992 RepID=A0A1H6D8J0_9ACTN|nr:MerR family transcriptional regulator [Thermomonospora echinospora]SEG81747.1 DNA-binding transcriptional regulator, MerR family [Thermomonospora echinospora]
MRIGEMVRRTGVSERLLRYYEEQGLLAPTRLSSGYRVYNDADVDTVRRIRTLLAAGLSTTTIAQVLPCVRDDGPNLAPVCPDLVATLRRERERIAHAIKNLQVSQDMLDAVIAAGPAETDATVHQPLPAR